MRNMHTVLNVAPFSSLAKVDHKMHGLMILQVRFSNHGD